MMQDVKVILVNQSVFSRVIQLEADKQMSPGLGAGLEPRMPALNPSSFYHMLPPLALSSRSLPFRFASGIWGSESNLEAEMWPKISVWSCQAFLSDSCMLPSESAQ